MVGISIIIISSVRRLTAHALGLRASFYTKRLNFLSFNNVRLYVDPTRSFCVEEGGGRDRPIRVDAGISFHSRRDSENRSQLVANIEDIITAFDVLDTKDLVWCPYPSQKYAHA